VPGNQLDLDSGTQVKKRFIDEEQENRGKLRGNWKVKKASIVLFSYVNYHGEPPEITIVDFSSHFPRVSWSGFREFQCRKIPSVN
jgi:hypothetical protein